jgi:MT0933-like antitoxin protein
MSGLTDKIKNLVDKHDKQVDQGITKAGDMVDERTGKKHSEQIDKAADKLRERD